MCEHVTVSGIMAFDPNLFEDGMNVDAETHHMVDYEISVEMFLAQRRRWLWRKALTHAWICAALICQSRRHIALQDKLGLPRTVIVMSCQCQPRTKDGPVAHLDTCTDVQKEWGKQKNTYVHIYAPNGSTYAPNFSESKFGHTIDPEKLKKWKKYAEREVERAGASGEAVDVYPKRKTLARIPTIIH